MLHFGTEPSISAVWHSTLGHGIFSLQTTKGASKTIKNIEVTKLGHSCMHVCEPKEYCLVNDINKSQSEFA
jgi:hypothetical protein